MKKTITLALVALLAFSLVGPAAAKKKKPKPAPAPVPVELQFFMRRDDCGTADADNPHLSLTDAEDADCGYTTTPANEVLSQFGVRETISYPAADGLPLTIDATRKVTGSISLRNFNSAGAGAVDVDLALVGTVAGEDKILGEFTTSYVALPATVEEIPYEMEIDPALNGVVVEGLRLDYFPHGVMVGIAGMIEHDDPVSYVKVPALALQ